MIWWHPATCSVELWPQLSSHRLGEMMNIHCVKPNWPLTVPPQTPLWIVDTNYAEEPICSCMWSIGPISREPLWRLWKPLEVTWSAVTFYCTDEQVWMEKEPFQLSKSIICAMSGKYKGSTVICASSTASHILNCILQPRRDSSSTNTDK